MSEPVRTGGTVLDPEPPASEALEALAPALERGRHLALVASEGAELGALYGAVAVRDLEEAGQRAGEESEEEAGGGEPGARAVALILTATPERARRVAAAVHRVARPAGRTTAVWTGEGRMPPPGEILVGTPAPVLTDIRSGRIPAADLRFLALDDVRALRGDWPAVEAILQSAGSDARRVLVTAERDEAFDELVTRQAPRARTWPPELFASPEEPAPRRQGPPLELDAEGARGDRVRLLVRFLHTLAAAGEVEEVTIWIPEHPGGEAGAELAATLATEGFALSDGEDEPAPVRLRAFGGSETGTGDGCGIAFGAPSRASELEAALGPAGRRVAIVEPRHWRHMELLAARLAWSARGLARSAPDFGDEVAAFRRRIEEGMERQDLGAATLLLEPLVERHGYPRVAAALAALLREQPAVRRRARDEAGAAAAGPAERLRHPTEPGRGPTERRERTGARARERGSAAATRAARPTWTRVFVNVGREAGVSPGDLVGAITGETGAAGGQIGKIEIRPRHSLVDVDSMIVDEVIRKLDGVRIKGQDVVVRLDRGR